MIVVYSVLQCYIQNKCVLKFDINMLVFIKILHFVSGENMANIREPTPNYMIRDKVKPIWCRMLNSNKLEHWRHDVDPIGSLDYYLHYRHCFQRIYYFRYFLNETSKFFCFVCMETKQFTRNVQNKELFTKNSMIKNVIRFVCSVGEMNFTNDC